MTASRIIAAILFFAVLFAGFLFLPVREWFVHLQAYIQSLGALGPAVVVLVYVFCTVLLVPGSAITIGAGTLFGLKTGLIVVVLGANLGALCAFGLARSVLREKVMSWAHGNPKFRALDQAIGKQGFKVVLLTRLSPVFPFVLLNYFLGITAVRTAPYVLANLLGMLPATFLFVYVGATAGEAVSGSLDGSADFYRQIWQYLGLLATLAVVIVVTRIARQALREAEEQQRGQFGGGHGAAGY